MRRFEMPLSFEQCLKAMDAERTKKYCKFWTKIREYSAGNVIKALDDCNRVQEVLDNATDDSKILLGFIRMAGGRLSHDTANFAYHVAGDHPRANSAESDKSFFDSNYKLPGLECFFAMAHNEYPHKLIADQRVLIHVGLPPVKPFAVPQSAHVRGDGTMHPSAAMINLAKAAGALIKIGRFRCNSDGHVNGTDINRFTKAVGWESSPLLVDSFLKMAIWQGWLVRGEKEYDNLFQMADLPDSPRRLVMDMLQSSLTHIHNPEERDYPRYKSESRLLLALTALLGLPRGGHFHSINAIGKVMFDRWSVAHLKVLDPSKFTPQQLEKSFFDSLKEQRDWSSLVTGTVKQAMTTWFQPIGLVETAQASKDDILVRLTPFGQEILDGSEANPANRSDSHAHPWVVQPNFEILAHLDRLDSAGTAFLTRIAELTKTDIHCAHFRLTRESVCAALQRERGVDVILSKLQAGSSSPLPSNIIMEIRGWNARSERVTLHRKASIMEFPDAAARDAASAIREKSVPLGDRFLLLSSPNSTPPKNGQKIDYEKAVPKSIDVEEFGRVSITRPDSRDLFLFSVLRRWADQQADGSWQITRASFSRLSATAKTLPTHIAELNARSESAIPSLLESVIHKWSIRNSEPPARLGDAFCLDCSNEDTLNMLLRSQKIRETVVRRLYSGTVLLDRKKSDFIASVLDWVGIPVTNFDKTDNSK